LRAERSAAPFALRLELRQQRVHRLASAPEVGCLQACQHRGEIGQPASRREVEHAKRSRDRKSFRACRRDPRPVVHQHEIGPERMRQRNRGALAGVERGQQQRRKRRGLDKLEPRRARGQPVPDHRRCARVAQFVTDDRRSEDPSKQARQQVDCFNQS